MAGERVAMWWASMVRQRILLVLRLALWASVVLAAVLIVGGWAEGWWPAALPPLLFAGGFGARYVPLPRHWDGRHPPQYSGCAACETWAVVTGEQMVQPLRDLEEIEAGHPE